MVNSGLGDQPDAESGAEGMYYRIDVLEHLLSLVDSLQLLSVVRETTDDRRG